MAPFSTREYLKEEIQLLLKTISDILRDAIPVMFASNRPDNEPDLNNKVNGLLRTHRDDLTSEHPTCRFACASVVPDHEFKGAPLLIESKFIRGATSPSKASEGIAADLTKYPNDKFTLFLVYDPDRAIKDDNEYQRDFEASGRCKILIVR